MPEQNPEQKTEKIPSFEEALHNNNELLHGLLNGEIQYDQERTPGELFLNLKKVQTAGRKDISISSVPINLNNELAILAFQASEAAKQHSDIDTSKLFLQIKKGLEVKEGSPQVQNKPSGINRITVRGPARIRITE